MIAETVRLFRSLTDPFRRSTWWPRRKPEIQDAPGVVLVSFYEIDGKARRRLLSRYLRHRRQALKDDVRPEVLPETFFQVEGKFEFCLHLMVFLWRTLAFAPSLSRGELTWARHLCECQSMARAQQQLMQGEPVVHLGVLRSHRLRDVLHLQRLVRHLPVRRYEIWLVFRSRQEAYLPTELALPEEPLTAGELRRLAELRCHPHKQVSGLRQRLPPAGALRVMSYNVHSCIGLDARHSIRRIAEVLHSYSPHLVALQEVENGCRRSGFRDQVAELADLWPSEAVFFPTLDRNGGKYGIAVLSRWPIKGWTGRILPRAPRLVGQEERALLVVKVEVPELGDLTVMNTHLGLTPQERRVQALAIEAVLEECSGPLLLMGDLNCAPDSRVYQRFLEHLEPTQARPLRTWFGSTPLRVLDYIFFRGPLEVEKTFAPVDSLTRVASDHLPLITDFQALAKECPTGDPVRST